MGAHLPALRTAPAPCQAAKLSQELLECFDRQARIAHKTAHGEGVDRIVPRNRDDADAVGDNDVLPLTNDAKLGLFEGPNRV